MHLLWNAGISEELCRNQKEKNVGFKKKKTQYKGGLRSKSSEARICLASFEVVTGNRKVLLNSQRNKTSTHKNVLGEEPL
jgi:hypothetical protein